jgi:8-oxo-dGTP pyrophosphatase MutT (NUDIX family)
MITIYSERPGGQPATGRESPRGRYGFPMAPAPTWRPTARLLVFDALDRVLLFSADDPRGRVWFTPGGAIQRGETLAGAAVRELAEETGYLHAEAGLGPVVATCAGLWSTADGRVFFGADSFFLVRVADPVIRTDGQEPLERSVITGHRWWTPSDLREATEVVLPCGLPGLVASLLSEGIPERPRRLPWRAGKGLNKPLPELPAYS